MMKLLVAITLLALTTIAIYDNGHPHKGKLSSNATSTHRKNKHASKLKKRLKQMLSRGSAAKKDKVLDKALVGKKKKFDCLSKTETVVEDTTDNIEEAMDHVVQSCKCNDGVAVTALEVESGGNPAPPDALEAKGDVRIVSSEDVDTWKDFCVGVTTDATKLHPTLYFGRVVTGTKFIVSAGHYTISHMSVDNLGFHPTEPTDGVTLGANINAATTKDALRPYFKAMNAEFVKHSAGLYEFLETGATSTLSTIASDLNGIDNILDLDAGAGGNNRLYEVSRRIHHPSRTVLNPSGCDSTVKALAVTANSAKKILAYATPLNPTHWNEYSLAPVA